jgi:ribosomal protein S18 acetylase RimI-like enzyme
MLLRLAPQSPDNRWPCRAAELADAPALGALMLAAYQGTIDYDGETPEQAEQAARAMLAGEYGALIEGCSFVTERDGQPIGASIITLWNGAPLVCDIMVHPSWKNRGLGTFLLRQSAGALFARGYPNLRLFVTHGNDNALHVYQKLGFQAEEEQA